MKKLSVILLFCLGAIPFVSVSPLLANTPNPNGCDVCPFSGDKEDDKEHEHDEEDDTE